MYGWGVRGNYHVSNGSGLMISLHSLAFGIIADVYLNSYLQTVISGLKESEGEQAEAVGTKRDEGDR